MMSGHLVAILHSLPVGTGARTLSRIEIAREALGCTSASVANLYAAPLPNSNLLNLSGMEAAWQAGRDEIARELYRADTTDVLLGYGVQLPTGDQRVVFQAQLRWLTEQLGERQHRVWTFGGRPTHPSRWHRVARREAAESTVADSATALLTRSTIGAA
ncbi:hypothetical protein [uncultured Microbacterium sp.]|uniref:hypothetical protein n=1 Tax=uncultured Microbacterium sp. TaxID=191216 RepID=UPI0028DC24CC|nr:hypothetical protein [uncultured Microbacterium sp.]